MEGACKVVYYAFGFCPRKQGIMLKIMLGWRYCASRYIGQKWHFPLSTFVLLCYSFNSVEQTRFQNGNAAFDYAKTGVLYLMF